MIYFPSKERDIDMQHKECLYNKFEVLFLSSKQVLISPLDKPIYISFVLIFDQIIQLGFASSSNSLIINFCSSQFKPILYIFIILSL